MEVVGFSRLVSRSVGHVEQTSAKTITLEHRYYSTTLLYSLSLSLLVTADFCLRLWLRVNQLTVGEGRLSFSATSCRQKPLSPPYRILMRIHKPQIPQTESLQCLNSYSFRPFLTRNKFQEILGLEGSQNFLGKFRQVHNLKISDRLLRSKRFFQENIPGFICSVFCSA